MIVFVLGTAGSGKTTFSQKFSEYIEDTCLVNLDPGNDLKCDVSIREFVKAEEVMKKYNIGPNSAIIKSIEISLHYIDHLIEKLPDTRWKIVDTPGQLELFLYRDCGKKILEEFRKIDRDVALLFLIDALDVLSPENFVGVLAWSVIIALRLETEALTIINKKDLIKNLEEVKSKIICGTYFKELKEKDALSELIANCFSEFYEYSTIWKRPIFISAKHDKDFYQVKCMIEELFCTCGDI